MTTEKSGSVGVMVGRRRFLKYVIVGAAIAAAAGVGGRYFWEVMRPRPPPAPKEILIGVSVALTGPQAGFGTEELIGTQFAVEDVNAQGGLYVAEYGEKLPVRLIVYDNKTDPTVGVSNVDRLCLEDRVHVLRAASLTPVAVQEGAAAERNKTPCVGTMSTSTLVHKQGYRYVFNYFIYPELMSRAQYMLMNELRKTLPRDIAPKTVAILEHDSSAGKELAEAMAGHAKEEGYEVVAREKFTTDTKDFSPIIASLKKAQPDVIGGWILPPDAITFTRQMKELELDFKFANLICGSDPYPFGETLESLANYVCGETAWTYALKTGRNPELVERFKKLKGKLPTGCAFGCGYAATEIVLDAIKRAGTLDKEAIRDAIAATDLITVCGRARFDIKELPGRAAMDPIFIQWQPIKEKPFTTQQVFWPEEIATAKLVYPAPPWKERKL